MINNVGWNNCKKRYIEFWHRENHERPLVWVTSPKNGIDISKIVPHQLTQNNLLWLSGPYFFSEFNLRIPYTIEERWLDIEYIIKRARENFSCTFFGGESFPLLFPDLGPDIMGAILGCELQLGNNTTWCKPIITNWRDFNISPDRKWWDIIESMTKEMMPKGNILFLSQISILVLIL